MWLVGARACGRFVCACWGPKPFDAASQVLISPGTAMTSGAGQPTEDRTLTFSSSIDARSRVVSLAVAGIGLISAGPNSLLPAVAFLISKGADKIPASATDVNGSWTFFRCVVREGLAVLDDPAKALGAAIDLFENRTVARGAVGTIEKRRNVLKLVGAAFAVVGLTSAARDIWIANLDEFSQLGTDSPGDAHLDLPGTRHRPKRTAATPITLQLRYAGWSLPSWVATSAR